VKVFDVIIVGGGLAGLTAAIHLSRKNLSVLVFEKVAYPHHKVCGEYLSNEIIPYLDSLDVQLPHPAKINTLLLSNVKGKCLRLELPLGGIGISRLTLDHTLYQKAEACGVAFVFDTVRSIAFKDSRFEVRGTLEESFNAVLVIGAYGKRSQLDKELQRPFMDQRSPWLAIKAHYSHAGFPDNEVALPNFKGGYGGLSRTESGAVNFCYLAHHTSFVTQGNISDFTREVAGKNPFLEDFLHTATPLFDKPLSIAQISFEKKDAVVNHVLMCGDTAGLIHPLCGNGMAMAIHAAKIASEKICRFFQEDSYSRSQLESDYTKIWQQTFAGRLRLGRRLQNVLLNPFLADRLMGLATLNPRLLGSIIKRTHGQLITN
jgi:flavin-dependent dehydrogenase